MNEISREERSIGPTVFAVTGNGEKKWNISRQTCKYKEEKKLCTTKNCNFTEREGERGDRH